MAALRGLAAKFGRIPCAAALRSSRSSSSSSSLPKGDLENALLLKNKIESAKAENLWSSGNLIAQHCGQTEEIISQVSERHAKVSRAVRNTTLKIFFTGVLLETIRQFVNGYYYDDGFELAAFELEKEERQRQVGPQ